MWFWSSLMLCQVREVGPWIYEMSADSERVNQIFCCFGNNNTLSRSLRRIFLSWAQHYELYIAKISM